jgi:UDP-N-acetylmuramoyl-tripeptide--D-alanyl-D-alanine ligase
MATPIPQNLAPLGARDVAAATGGQVVARAAGRQGGSAPLGDAGPGVVAHGVTTDSRAVVPGGAFVAIRGAARDGHAFLGAALAAGAVLLVVERGRAPEETGRADVVEVDDTVAAWGTLARAHLRRWRRESPGARTVGITGSAGKTTTKEICAALLGPPTVRHATTGNLNNRIGLPAVALQVEARHRFLVLEMGMSEPGEIAALCAIAEPDVGVVTNVGLAHAGGVDGTLRGVATEKGALFEALRAGGVAWPCSAR